MAARFDWESIRAEYEVGASQSDLSKRYGVSRTAIQKRIRAEGWVQDISGTVNRMAEAKVAGVVTGCNPQKKAEAVERAVKQYRRNSAYFPTVADIWAHCDELRRGETAQADALALPERTKTFDERCEEGADWCAKILANLRALGMEQ